LDNRLKKSLEILKARAKRLSRFRGREEWIGKGGGPMNRTPADGGFRAQEEPWDFGFPLEGGSKPLEDVAPGEERETEAGTCYAIRTSVRAFCEDAGREAERLQQVLATPGSLECVFGESSSREQETVLPDPGRICFFDIETAGLTPNTYVFLGGVMFLANGELAVEQFLARDYAEENALLHALRDRFRACSHVITYNGLSFDMPFIRTRMAVYRIEPEHNFQTLDLLKPARRTFAAELANCKLETIERHLRGVARTGDIPGKYVPGVYHEFVRTQDARMLGGVLYHNQMDLLAMVILLNTLAVRT
jgi:uncharacterized protein YprB with RNaseH-like and TPR domain